MIRWKVKLEKKAEEELTQLLKSNIISSADIRVLLRWVSDMEEFGPAYISHSKEWHDHELEREWIGYRSSAFSKSGRVIYKVIDLLIVVQVARVTTNHDYKK